MPIDDFGRSAIDKLLFSHEDQLSKTLRALTSSPQASIIESLTFKTDPILSSFYRESSMIADTMKETRRLQELAYGVPPGYSRITDVLTGSSYRSALDQIARVDAFPELRTGRFSDAALGMSSHDIYGLAARTSPVDFH